MADHTDTQKPPTLYQRWMIPEDEHVSTTQETINQCNGVSNHSGNHLVKEFCEESAILGFLYLSDVRRPFIERLCWAVSMVTCLLASLLLIQKVYHKWSTAPVIVSFSQTPTPNWEIPFPAVTICPQIKYSRKKLKKGESLFMNRTYVNKYRRILLDDVALLCRRYSGLWDSLTPDLYGRFANDDIYDRIKFATGAFAEYPDLPKYLRCKYGYKTVFCEDNFQEIFTSDGWCQAFNLLPRGTLFTEITSWRGKYQLEKYPVVDWSLDEGFMVAVEVDTTPYRITNSVYDRGLMMMMTADVRDLDYSCQEVQGYKIALTNPAEFPRTNDRFNYIPLSGLTQMIIEPRIMATSDSLRSYDPKERHCFFSSERKLAYFTTYTQSNCDLECLTNFTLEECKCVEFFMPRQKETLICGLGSSACVRKTEKTTNVGVALWPVRLHEESMAEIVTKVKSNHTCDCIPECTSIQYQAEVIHSEYDVRGADQNPNKRTRNNTNEAHHRVVISFKTTEVLSRQRSPLYNYTDLIASCGGLLSLFFGFSILSLLEIFYFFSLRIIFNYAKKKRK